jgi:hypothetical protein
MKTVHERRLDPAERKPKSKARRVPESLNGKAVVDEKRLSPNRGDGDEQPEFLKRGYYQDKSFTCRDCGKVEVWTAAAQKWWYEIAQGDRLTQATRCQTCRRRERERRNEARRASAAGLAAKRARVK